MISSPTSSLETLLQKQSHFHPEQQTLCYENSPRLYLDFPIAAPVPPPDLDIAPCFTLDNYHFSLQDDPMHPDPWGPARPFSSKFGRISHHRESSFSSLGSSGPVSPFQQPLANPHISISDSSKDAMMEMQSNDLSMSHSGGASYYQFAKPLESYQPFHNLDNAAVTEMAYPVTIPGPTPKQRPRVDRSLLPAPDFVSGSSRSHPTSVASSIAGDSPATPTMGETDPMDRRRPGHNAPKLDRTMTDVYGDELYSPNFTITSSSPSHATNVAALPNNDVFNQRLSAANSQHLQTSHQSPPSTLSRDMSPFRNGSPLTPMAAQDWINKGNVAFNSAQRIREQNKAQQDARVVQQQQRQRKLDSRTPQTISPKDAMLEFNDADEEAHFPLFPQSTADFAIDQLTGVIPGVSTFPDSAAQISYGHSHISSTVQVPQQYPFISQQHTIQHPPVQRTGSGGSNSTRATNSSPVQGRPSHVGTDGGTYTCTYHGCTLRFETPSLLQRHKREGHRQTHTLGGGLRHQDASPASGLLNSQAGPHQCNRINPSTGKPCNTVFSRPYDLTRHEDTIHNARKQKVHCNICTEDKTFSRADALTRHYRVCHPDMELPGKHRRRGGL